MRVLALNPGSSSLKASVIEEPGDRTLAKVDTDWSAGSSQASRSEAVAAAVSRLTAGSPIHAVGYRVVHGGTKFMAPTRIDEEVVSAIRDLDALAPQHNLAAAEVIRAARELLPDVPHVACFDTAFHAHLPESARRYPLPELWYSEWGVRRYGFHGLSVTWALERAAALLDRGVDDIGLVVAHLGSGCSATAVADGRSINTTMGMTPIEGLMMGTRSGSLDPAIVLLAQERGLSRRRVAEAIGHQAGLLGVSGRTADVRELELAASQGDARSALALEMFCARAAAGIAAMASSLDVLDAVAFTGGIGAGSHGVRRRVCARLAVLGVPVPNGDQPEGDGVIGQARGLMVLRVEAREDLVIARQVSTAS